MITTALARLATLCDDANLHAVASRNINLLSTALSRHGLSVPDLIGSMGWLECGVQVALPGSPGELLSAARTTFAPYAVIAHGDDADQSLFDGRENGLGYVCRHRACDLPTSDPNHLVAQVLAAVQI